MAVIDKLIKAREDVEHFKKECHNFSSAKTNLDLALRLKSESHDKRILELQNIYNSATEELDKTIGRLQKDKNKLKDKIRILKLDRNNLLDDILETKSLGKFIRSK